MDRTSGSSFRVTPRAGPTEPTCTGPDDGRHGATDTTADETRARLLPRHAGVLDHLPDPLSSVADDILLGPPASPQPQRVRADALRAAVNALAGGLAHGACLGTCFALGNFIRATAHPGVKEFSSMTPMAFAALTPYTEPELRQFLGAASPPFTRPTDWQNAVLSAELLAAHMTYQLSRNLPQTSRTAPAGAATALKGSFTATESAEAVGEAMAQRSHHGTESDTPRLDTKSEDEVRRPAIDRGLSMGSVAVSSPRPAAHATPHGNLTPAVASAAIAVAAFGSGLSHRLMPPPRAEDPSQPGKDRP